jgi:hypothetical protein
VSERGDQEKVSYPPSLSLPCSLYLYLTISEDGKGESPGFTHIEKHVL